MASVLAFQNKNIELANKYCDVALEDAETYNDALDLKMYLMQQSLKNHDDSVKCVKQFEAL